jgi:hypothetical protein
MANRMLVVAFIFGILGVSQVQSFTAKDNTEEDYSRPYDPDARHYKEERLKHEQHKYDDDNDRPCNRKDDLFLVQEVYTAFWLALDDILMDAKQLALNNSQVADLVTADILPLVASDFNFVIYPQQLGTTPVAASLNTTGHQAFINAVNLVRPGDWGERHVFNGIVSSCTDRNTYRIVVPDVSHAYSPTANAGAPGAREVHGTKFVSIARANPSAPFKIQWMQLTVQARYTVSTTPGPWGVSGRRVLGV